MAYPGKSITAHYAPTSYGHSVQITPLSVKKSGKYPTAVWTSFDVILQKITDDVILHTFYIDVILYRRSLMAMRQTDRPKPKHWA